MTVLDRNLPCPCGSGKKYKKCCFISDWEQEQEYLKAREIYDFIWPELLGIIEHANVKSIVDSWREFTDDKKSAPDPDDPDYYLFVHWAAFQMRLEHGRKKKSQPENVRTLALIFLEEQRETLEEDEIEFLERSFQTALSCHEVKQVKPGIGLTLRDIMTEDTVFVCEKSASLTVEVGDMLFAAVLKLPSVNMMLGCGTTLIPSEYKTAFLELRKELLELEDPITRDTLTDQDMILLWAYRDFREEIMNQEAPVMQNTDGDPFLFHTLKFKLNMPPEDAVRKLSPLCTTIKTKDLLDDIERDKSGSFKSAEFPWTKKGNKQHQHWDNTVLGHIRIARKELIIEVNSEKRAETIRKRVEKLLGMGVQHKGTVISDPSSPKFKAEQMRKNEKNMESLSGDEMRELMENDPAIREIADQEMRKHCEIWLEMKIPALKNLTPREAVQDKDLREAVDGLLLQMERHLEKDEYSEMMKAHTEYLRKELELELEKG